MAVLFILSNNILEKNGGTYMWPATPQGLSQTIPTENIVMEGVFWKRPIKRSNEIVLYVADAVNPSAPSTPPTPDSVKMLRLKNTLNNDTWGIAIANTDETSSASPQSAWAFRANGTGGTLPVMPAVTVPYPIFQNGPTSTNTAGTNVFLFRFPGNPQALLYAIQGAWFNGVAPTQAYQPAGITTLAQFVTWANTSGKWPMYGTWSSPNATTLKLTSTTGATIHVNEAGILNSLTPAVLVLDMTVVATPAAVNGVGFGGSVPISFPAFDVTDTAASMTALINAISHIYQPNQVSMAIDGTTTTNINVTTKLGQCIVYYDTTPVVTST